MPETQRNNWPIGGAGNPPFPMTYIDGEVERMGRLNTPISLSSELPYDRFIGILMRELPLPSMMDSTLRAMEMMQPDSEQRVMFLVGDPGLGKTYTFGWLARLVSQHGAMVIDCAEKDMRELLFETVLDIQGAKSLRQKIDDRLAQTPKNAIGPMADKALRDALGSHLIEEDGRYSVDWENITFSPPPDTELITTPENELQLDKVKAGLREFCNLEGLDNVNVNSLGLTQRQGPLIQAWESGQIPILDEYNKRKKGTENILHNVWPVMQGHTSSHTVRSGTMEYTFKHADRKPGWVSFLTGNTKSDGIGTEDLSESGIDRVDPYVLGEMTVEDWQHRFCQVLTGIPISTHYKINKQYWDENPDAFSAYLLGATHPDSEEFVPGLQTIGMTDDEIAAIPDYALKTAMLEHWDKVLIGSEILAEAFHELHQILDPTSQIYRENRNLRSVAKEVNDPAIANMLRFGARHMITLIRNASRHAAQVVDNGEPVVFSLLDTPLSIPAQAEDIDSDELPAIETIFGTRMTEEIQRLAYNYSLRHGKDQLFGEMQRIFARAGVYDIAFEEGIQMEPVQTLEDIFDLKPHEIGTPPTDAGQLRNVLCSFIQMLNPDLDISHNDTLMTVADVETALSQMQRAPARLLHEASALIIPVTDNRLFDVGIFEQVFAHDALPQDPDLHVITKVDEKLLLPLEQLLFTLSIGIKSRRDANSIGTQNIEALWQQSLRSHVVFQARPGPVGEEATIKERRVTEEREKHDKALAIAEGHSDDPPLAITTIQCGGSKMRGSSGPTTLHIVRNTELNMTMIVGNASIDERLARMLAGNAVKYIDTTGNRVQVESEINENLVAMTGNSFSKQQLLQQAHQMRNTGINTSGTFAGILANNTAEQSVTPVYVTSLSTEADNLELFQKSMEEGTMVQRSKWGY